GVGGVGTQAAVLVAGDVGADLIDLAVATTARLALELDACLIRGVVGPDEAQAARGGAADAQVAGGGGRLTRRAGGAAGLVGVVGVPAAVVGPHPIRVGGAGVEPAIVIGGDVGADLGHLAVAAGARLPLDRDTVFVARGVGPGERQPAAGGIADRQVAGGGGGLAGGAGGAAGLVAVA